MTLSPELEEVLHMGLARGERARVIHVYKSSGEVCSKGKNPALSVLRTGDGYLCFCHRCGESFYLRDTRSSPTETLERLRAQNEPVVDVVEKASLPPDYVGMWLDNSPVITAAYTWLWSFHMKQQLFKKYDVGWSSFYQRIIFPVYDSILLNSGEMGKKLLGWVGRDPVNVPKEKRTLPKWLTKREKGTPRFFYTCLSKSDNIIIVEDIVSAIRVHEASGWNSMALLTTSLPSDLMVKLNKYNVYVWLDSNMVSKSLGYVAKLNSFGITSKFVHSTLDPKEYSDDSIRATLFKERGANADRTCHSTPVL